MKRKLLTIIIALPLILLAGGSEEIDKAIAQMPAMMLSQTDNVGAYIRQTCGKIAKIPDAQLRYRCFRKLMESACKVRLENVEGMVPLQPITMPDVEEFRRENLRRVLQQRACWFREQKIASIKGDALGRLRLMADQIFDCHLVGQPVPAPCTELFEPYFKLIEKYQEVERTERRESMSLCGDAIDQVEYLYNFIYFKTMRVTDATPDAQDITAFEARFKQVTGRSVRSAEQYEADSRRRVEENIKEHRKQQEINRRALEFQKKYNEEHNNNVK